MGMKGNKAAAPVQAGNNDAGTKAMAVGMGQRR